MTKTGHLPLVYSRWLKEVLPGDLPVETEADCAGCVMCADDENTNVSGRIFFSPDSKCCTYNPALSNFMAGGILAETSPAMAVGRQILENRLNKLPGAYPLAVLPPPVYNLLYRHSSQAFGRNTSLRCPYYDITSGSCTIWPYREPTCATWYCKHSRGMVGQSFWQALHSFLAAVSKDLSLWCVLQLDIGEKAFALILDRVKTEKMSGEDMLPNEIDSKPDRTTERQIWGNRQGRERHFYLECAELVNNMAWSRVADICGPETHAALLLLQRAYSGVQEKEIPANLRLGKFSIVGGTSETVLIKSYSQLDLLELPLPLFKALTCFHGQSTIEGLNIVSRCSETAINTRMLHLLLDFGILEGHKEPA